MDRGIIINEKFIAKLKKGDVESFHQLYDSIAPAMRMVCKRYVGNNADAEDVFHEGFLKIYKNIGTLKNDSAFFGWLKRIFINTALDHCKNLKKETTENIDDINEIKIDLSDESEELITASEFVKAGASFETIRKIDFTQDEMLGTLENIPEHFRVVFQLFVIDGYQHRDIAEMLVINEKTSKTRLLRARGLLKEELYKLAIQRLRDGRS